MIKNHSLCFYDMGMNVRYKMIDFENIKTHKKLNCVYSHGEDCHFKRVFIDTELSPNFRYEVWIENVCYILELVMVALPVMYKKTEIKKFNVEVKATILKDNEYEEFYCHVGDSNNFKLKEGAWNQNYMIEYGKEVFDFHKEKIVDLMKNGINQNLHIRIWKQRFAQESFSC